MLEVLDLLLKGGIISAICFISCYFLKYSVVKLICANPDLSDEKVKAITKMISKDINIKL